MILVLFVVPVVAQAMDIRKGGLLENIEPILQVFNLLLALIVLMLAISVLPTLVGNLRRSWLNLAAAVGLFALIELFAALKGLEILNLRGLGGLIESVFIIVRFIAIYNMQSLFKSLSVGKK